MKIQSQKLNSVAINQIELDQEKVVVSVPGVVNHLFACDVSYSMVSDLAKMRKQLKNRIPSVIGENDTITIIWFSGRGQAGILKEAVQVNNVNDLQMLNTAIDRFIVPVGATSFLDPVELAEGVLKRLIAANPDAINSFSFLTDGYNNSSVWSDVIKALERVEPLIGSSTMIEYGYYANSDAMSEMAETLGGQKIFAKDFDSYEIEFEKQFKANSSTTKRIAFDITQIKAKMQYAFLFTITDSGIVVYGATGKNEILIPENTTDLYFFSEYAPSEYEKATFSDEVLYAGAYVLADKLKYKLVDGILSALGDVKIQDLYTNSYGKQKLNEFKEQIKAAVYDPSLRFTEGKEPGKAVKANAYCFMNLIDDLMQDDGNVFYPYHPDFNYNRIGAKSVTKTELTDDQKESLSKAKTLKELEAIQAAVEVAEFIYPDNQAEQGQGFSSLVWNESRANLSITTKLFGQVKVPTNNFGIDLVDSFIYRSYTFVKDGVLNVTEIPVTLTNHTFDKLQKLVGKTGLTITTIDTTASGEPVFLLNFAKLPTINRKMATNTSAKELAKLEYNLMLVQNRQKYLKVLNEKLNPKTNVHSEAKYSVEAAAWLKSIGVNDFNGFSPKTDKVLLGDIYMATNLETKVKGYSSIPSIESVNKKITDGKSLNPSDTMLKESIDKVDKELKGKDEEAQRIYLKDETKQANYERRHYLSEIAQIKFGIILSRTWFTEFKDFTENSLAYTADGLNLHYVFDYVDKEVKL